MAITRPANIPVPFAVSGSKNTIPVASQIGITNGAASYTDGFPPLTMTPIVAGGVPPAGQDMNGIFNALSSHTVFQNAGGRYQFDATLATSIGGYPTGVVLQDNAGRNSYVNVLANNSTDFNATPAAIGVSWLPYAGPALLSVGGPVVGTARNARMNVATASAAATLTADEIVTETTLGGVPYRLANFSKSINLATTGAGGMDTGAAPVSGYVALYAIFNPTTGAAALLATNANTLQPNVYGGANMPAGYIASALVSVWPTNGSSQFVVGIQADRAISFAQRSIYNSTTIPTTPTALNIPGVIPVNARVIHGTGGTGSATTSQVYAVYISADGVISVNQITGYTVSGGATGANFRVQLVTPQQVYYSGSAGSGTTFALSASGYEF